VLAKYFLHELRLGQVNLVVMAVMLLATRVLSRPADARRDAESGVLAGIAAALKPYALVFLPYFVVTRNWMAAAATVATLVVALCVPVLFYGIHGNIQALRDWAVTLSQSTPAQLTNNDNVSVLAFFTKWLGPGTVTLVVSGVVLAVLAVLMLAVIVRGRGDRTRAVLECGLLLTLIPLVSPMGWDYTFLLALLAVALLINAFGAFPRGAQVVLAVNFAVIALAVFDVMGRRAYAAFMQWSVTTVNFAIVVIALVYLRFRTEL
jgi:alpha-1,2-mannosyltransferase